LLANVPSAVPAARLPGGVAGAVAGQVWGGQERPRREQAKQQRREQGEGDNGDDGSASFITYAVADALREASVEPAEIEAFRDQCASSDSEDRLGVCVLWVEVAA
jgi:hypothetical protein